MRKKVKKLADGGPFQWGEREDGLDLGKGIGVAGNLTGGILDAVDPGDEYGVRSGGAAMGSGVLKGAAAGAALGPAGVIAGGVAGLIGGLLGNKKAKKIRKEATANKMIAMDKSNKLLSTSIMQTDPTSVAGRQGVQMYKYGGTLKGAPSTSFKLPSALARVPKVDILPTVAISPRKMMANGGKVPSSVPESTKVVTPKLSQKPILSKGFTERYLKNGGTEPTLSALKALVKRNGGAQVETSDSPITNAINDRAYYNPFTKEAVVNTTAIDKKSKKMAKSNFYGQRNIREDMKGSVIKETAHGKQFEKGILKPGLEFLTNDLPAYIKGEDPYLKKNTLEYNAHEVIEPRLHKEFEQDLKDANQPGVLEGIMKKQGGKAPKKMVNGGSLKALSSTAVEVKGPSHAKGGVKIPHLGVELEGKETVSDGFVFSDKLGFAEQHKPIALAIGKTEKMPESASTRRTLKALTGQEERLKMKQEQTKQQLGIPSSLTKMENGGDLDPTEKRKRAISVRLNEIKKANRGILFDDRFKGTPTAAHKEYKALLAENKALINGKSPITSGKNQGFIDALAAGKAPVRTPLPITQVRNGKTKVLNPPAGKINLSQDTIDKTGYTGQTAASRKKSTGKAVPRALINDPQLTDPKAIIAAEARKDAWIKKGLTPKAPNIPTTITRPDNLGVSTGKAKDAGVASRDNKVNKAVDAIAPFTSNIANMFRKLPKPPTPSAQSALTPSLLDLSADRAEAVRQRRGADASADATLNGGNATTASRAANLSQQIRATSAINQSENNVNSQIKNQFQMLNSQIDATNNAKQDQYNTQLVERQLKQQELTAENLADIGNKTQVLSRDQKLFDLEDDKLLLEVGKDPTGASFRATEGILKKRMTPAAFAALQASNKIKEQNALEENVALRKSNAGNPTTPKALAK